MVYAARLERSGADASGWSGSVCGVFLRGILSTSDVRWSRINMHAPHAGKEITVGNLGGRFPNSLETLLFLLFARAKKLQPRNTADAVEDRAARQLPRVLHRRKR